MATMRTEPHSAAGAGAATVHTHTGAEQQVRTTVIALVAAAQNGTSGVIAGTHHFG
jgi:hypothetical protein